MAPNEILAELRQHPFEAFRLHLADGSSYDVCSPELCMVGLTSIIIGLTKTAGDELFERTVKLDPFHITHIEPLPSLTPKGNGQTGG
jgi:hypothetical protein